MMNRSILMQIFLSFFLPLEPGHRPFDCGHRRFQPLTEYVRQAPPSLRGTIFSGLFLLAIYGGYFLFTYFSCKGMINQAGAE